MLLLWRPAGQGQETAPQLTLTVTSEGSLSIVGSTETSVTLATAADHQLSMTIANEE